jgi:hypothetical protein
VDTAGLDALGRDAAARAWALLADDSATGLELSRDEDLARRAARLIGGPELPAVARAAGMSSTALASWGRAWRHAGPDGLRALTSRWPAPAVLMADARSALADLDGGTSSRGTSAEETVSISANRATLGRIQLRLGEDDRWYLFTKSFNRWDLVGGPAEDPADLLTALGH